MIFITWGPEWQNKNKVHFIPTCLLSIQTWQTVNELRGCTDWAEHLLISRLKVNRYNEKIEIVKLTII